MNFNGFPAYTPGLSIDFATKDCAPITTFEQIVTPGKTTVLDASQTLLPIDTAFNE